MDIIAVGITVGVAIGLLVVVILVVEGKSGNTLLDHASEWCRNHLPW